MDYGFGMDDQPSQLVNDLRLQSHRKLGQWVKDTASLFEMAGCDSREFVFVLITELILQLATAAHSIGMPEKIVIEAYKILAARKRKGP